MVHTAMDFWGRRTGRIYFDIESVRKYGPKFLEDFRSYFGWDETRLAYERNSLVEALQEAAEFPPRRETENLPDPNPEM
jgi:glycerol-3-phosphate dehydrogenase